jgi:hypothetical protein
VISKVDFQEPIFITLVVPAKATLAEIQIDWLVGEADQQVDGGVLRNYAKFKLNSVSR